MPVEILTKQDLYDFEQRILREIQKMMTAPTLRPEDKTWLKTEEVLGILDISIGTLRKLRKSRQLKCKKFGGVYYYDHLDIKRRLDMQQ